MKTIRAGRSVLQALDPFVAGFKIGVAAATAQKNGVKLLIGLALATSVCCLPVLAQERQERNEVGLQIGGIVTPSQGLAQGANLIGPGGTTLPTQDLPIASSLTLGAEYDRAVLQRQKFAIDGGIDFLASPLDVKLSQSSQNAIGQYAFVFLTPHVRLKFHPQRAFSPWLLFGGGYARLRESAPTAVSSFKSGTNTGTFVFGGGVDTRPVIHIRKIGVGFRLEVRDFYSGLPNYNVNVGGGLQTNLAFTGGLLLKF